MYKRQVHVGAVKEVQELLQQYGSTPLKNGISLGDLIRRPELSYDIVAPLDKKRPELPYDVREQININIKYDGYIRRQLKQVEGFKTVSYTHLVTLKSQREKILRIRVIL